MTAFHDGLPQNARLHPEHLWTSVYSLVRDADAFSVAMCIPLRPGAAGSSPARLVELAPPTHGNDSHLQVVNSRGRNESQSSTRPSCAPMPDETAQGALPHTRRR